MTHDKQKPIVENFHKATTLLAEKLVGETSDKFSTFPFVAKVDSGHYALFVPGVNPNIANYDYIHAFIVNAGLTLELKLKHLHMLENKKTPRGHNLLTLFNELGEDTKAFLNNHVEQQTKNSSAHLAITEAAKINLNISISWKAGLMLQKSSYAFERWRYAYEAQNDGSWFYGYIELYRALDARIKLV
ncbi:hypothetical protein [Oleiagrimonas sp. MCCC 1A03011]|uniref:hypothetical protein n=1 Tax=Oleiagrimonas sp. MCCC 1A03011 TaxID=1926883 RepID=UPI0011BE575A|nr:hypothetical protein [Oleiagrimonas sp. MCCC 1A03011]